MEGACAHHRSKRESSQPRYGNVSCLEIMILITTQHFTSLYIQVKDEEDIGQGNDKLLRTFDVFGKLFMVRMLFHL